jgi:hypothetical protein
MFTESGEKLLQAEAILMSLTGSVGIDEMREEHVQTMLILCTQLVSSARASLPA